VLIPTLGGYFRNVLQVDLNSLTILCGVAVRSSVPKPQSGSKGLGKFWKLTKLFFFFPSPLAIYIAKKLY
jgi:hypothetical protein